jgi:hypothetical protein
VACEPQSFAIGAGHAIVTLGGRMRRLEAENPLVSSDEIADILIAADCPIVGQMANVSLADKWRLIWRFDRMLTRQFAANAMPRGSLIVANAPLQPTIDQKRGLQAQAGGQSTLYDCHPDPRGGTMMMPWSQYLDLILAMAKLSGAGGCRQADWKPRRIG